MLHQRTIPELIHTAQALKTKAEHAEGKAEQYYTSLGLTLAELKQRKPTDTKWPAFVKKYFNYSRARADELIRIADGRTSVEEVREKRRDDMQRSRKNSLPRGSGKIDVGSSTSVERRIAKKTAEPVALNMQVNELVRKLDDFIDDWSDDVKTFWAEHQFKLEDDGGKDCLMQFMETSAMKLWRLAQALDGREPQTGDEHD